MTLAHSSCGWPISLSCRTCICARQRSASPQGKVKLVSIFGFVVTRPVSNTFWKRSTRDLGFRSANVSNYHTTRKVKSSKKVIRDTCQVRAEIAHGVGTRITVVARASEERKQSVGIDSAGGLKRSFLEHRPLELRRREVPCCIK